MNVWVCDRCKKSFIRFEDINKIKIFEKSQKKGGKAVCYDICKMCWNNFLGDREE